MLNRVTSADDTTITWSTSGTGPPLVLVHGSGVDHTRWGPLLPHLEKSVTVHAVDRRGRGSSQDHARWAIEREYEDLAAVVDQVAADAGQPLTVYGHAFGAVCALGAATLTDHVARLALYEPPIHPPMVHAEEHPHMKLSNLLRVGKEEAAIEYWFRHLVGMDEAEFADHLQHTYAPVRDQIAHTLPREHRAGHDWDFDPARFGAIGVPTVVFTGTESPAWKGADAWLVSEVLPDVHVRELPGFADDADLRDPAAFAHELLLFALANA